MTRLSSLIAAVTLAGAVGGCNVPPGEPLGAFAAADTAAIPVIHRTFFDALYSVVTGRDCSAVRLDQNKSYCAPVEPPPAVPPYCTRSRGDVDCWIGAGALPPPPPRPVADGPVTLTPEQDRDRLSGWPKL